MSRLQILAQSFNEEPSEFAGPATDVEKTITDRLTFVGLVLTSSGVVLILFAAALGWLG